MSIPHSRAVRRAGENYFGPHSEAVSQLLARISAASSEQLTLVAGAPSGTAYLVALGAAWRAARKSGLSKQVERASEAAFAATAALPDPSTSQKAADALANAAIATALGNKLEARYAGLLLDPAKLLETQPA